MIARWKDEKVCRTEDIKKNVVLIVLRMMRRGRRRMVRMRKRRKSRMKE